MASDSLFTVPRACKVAGIEQYAGKRTEDFSVARPTGQRAPEVGRGAEEVPLQGA